MLKLIECDKDALLKTQIHLNTSHVKVNPKPVAGLIKSNKNLNTSHVKVNL